MKALILSMAENYPELLATQTTNSFGDQIIEIVAENVDGSKVVLLNETNSEGNWIEFTAVNLLKTLTNLNLICGDCGDHEAGIIEVEEDNCAYCPDCLTQRQENSRDY